MKPKEWEGNSNSFSVTYHLTHDGPNYFVTHYKGSTRGHVDPKEAWRVHGVAKFTDSAQAMKAWCIETYETFDKELKKARKDTSFASEVESEQDPTANTKMVT